MIMAIVNKGTALHFFCGKMAAGKSTLAKQLATKHDTVLLIEDDWLKELYPNEINTIADYLDYSARLKNLLSNHIKSLLLLNVSVVLDFPGNTKDQRLWFRSIIEAVKCPHILHFVDKSDELCKQQLKQRSHNNPHDTAFTTEEEFDAITKYFQAPVEEEGFNVVNYDEKGKL
jgi:predicted kinase